MLVVLGFECELNINLGFVVFCKVFRIVYFFSYLYLYFCYNGLGYGIYWEVLGFYVLLEFILMGLYESVDILEFCCKYL